MTTRTTLAQEPIDAGNGLLARRPTPWDLSMAPGGSPIMRPLQVRGHTPRDSITSGEALNLVDPEIGHAADWHDFCWRTDANPPPFAAHSTDKAFRLVASVLQGDRVFDCRDSLRSLMHPAAQRSTPVWCARHDRAILEMAWERWETGDFSARWPLAPSVVDDWIWTPAQMDSLKELAERVEPHIPEGGRRGWRIWWSEQLRYGINAAANP